jgi:hypothetical protein
MIQTSEYVSVEEITKKNRDYTIFTVHTEPSSYAFDVCIANAVKNDFVSYFGSQRLGKDRRIILNLGETLDMDDAGLIATQVLNRLCQKKNLDKLILMDCSDAVERSFVITQTDNQYDFIKSLDEL